MQSIIDNAPKLRSLRSDLITARAHHCLATTPSAADTAPDPTATATHIQAARKLLANYLPARHPLLANVRAPCPGMNWLASQ